MADDKLLRRIDRMLEKRDHEQREWLETQRREQREWLDAHTERQVAITQDLIASIHSGFAQLQAEIADQRAQIKANTDALLKVLDRFGPSPS